MTIAIFLNDDCWPKCHVDPVKCIEEVDIKKITEITRKQKEIMLRSQWFIKI